MLPLLGSRPELVRNSTSSRPILNPESYGKPSAASVGAPTKATSHPPAIHSPQAAQKAPEQGPATATTHTPAKGDGAADRPLDRIPAAKNPVPKAPNPEVLRLKDLLRKFQKEEVLLKEQAKKAQRQNADMGVELAQLKKHLEETGKAEQKATRNLAAARAKVEDLRAELADARAQGDAGTAVQDRPRQAGESQDGEAFVDWVGGLSPSWAFRMLCALMLGALLGWRCSAPGAVRRKERERQLRAETDARVRPPLLGIACSMAYPDRPFVIT
jgi:hypothetical protein